MSAERDSADHDAWRTRHPKSDVLICKAWLRGALCEALLTSGMHLNPGPRTARQANALRAGTPSVLPGPWGAGRHSQATGPLQSG